jgi:hypothetical protein
MVINVMFRVTKMNFGSHYLNAGSHCHVYVYLAATKLLNILLPFIKNCAVNDCFNILDYSKQKMNSEGKRKF